VITITETADQLPPKQAITIAEIRMLHAAVFGSVARGEAGPSSDVDFLVEFESGRTLLDLSGLVIDLREALGCNVDVVTRNALHPKLRDAILSEAVPIL
jgi:hypothetical protein